MTGTVLPGPKGPAKDAPRPAAPIRPEDLPQPEAWPRVNRALLAAALLGAGALVIVPVFWRFYFPGALSVASLVVSGVGYRQERKGEGPSAFHRDCFVAGLVTGAFGVAAIIVAWLLHTKGILR